MNNEVTYDKYGRMNFHPDYHTRQGLPWTEEEKQYLIDYYELTGPEETSLALERTIHTVMSKAYLLRKKGLMPNPPPVKRTHKRIRLSEK